MGFKTPWFQLLSVCLFVSTVAYSKPLPFKLTSEDCAESCNTAKEGIVHKIVARDLREDQKPSEYQSDSDINHEEQNIASLSDFDIEEIDGDDGGAQDESANSGDGFIDIGGAHLDKTVDDEDADDDADDWTTHLELPIKAINDSVDDTFWGNDVVIDELSKETHKDDEDDTSGTDDDDTSGRDDDYAADKVDDDKSNAEIDDEILDSDDDDDSYDDDDDTFDVDDDADDYESNAEETQDEDDGDSYDDVVNLDHATNSPDDDDTYDDVVNLDHMTNSRDDNDAYDDVVNLDHVINSPKDDDDTFRVNNVVDDSIKLPDQTTIDPTNGNGVEGPIQILEENHPHDPKPGHKSKFTQHHNPLNKHRDSKLGRLLTKHKDNGLTSIKSGKNNHHKDIYKDEDDYNDFESQTRKHKFPRHKGRRTLSVDENPDFEHVGNRDDVSGTEDQENLGNYVEGSVDNYDKAETIVDDKESPALVQEDQIEGQGEEEEEEDEVKFDDENVPHSRREAAITTEDLLTDSGDQDNMVL
ncbi:protein PFC0760c-like [Actinia tenebrosa]|uniref:Protein PFC0760c-like n=1 Tax=Actinia tenebrosa TaxID=6105 RepID=A0A6P8IUI5_ACTTE|nr:protein PFC0760c-like [Actinia tenebrosa]